MQTNKQQTCLYNDIYESWTAIKEQQQQAISCASKHDWLGTQRACLNRKRQLDAHFKQYPISPGTAFFYRHHLSEHLRNEETLEQLHKIASRKSLRLIK